MIKILFVCLGNICRSPAAEGVMKHLLESKKLEREFFVDSAGTIGYHAGSPADARMRAHAQRRGILLESISRPFVPHDFEHFDYVIAMDDQNYTDLEAFDPQGNYRHKLFRMTSFCRTRTEKEVPDPYYGGDKGFELVLDILEDACQGLLEKVKP